MPQLVDALKLHEAYRRGRDRVKPIRLRRAQAYRRFAGQHYYDYLGYQNDANSNDNDAPRQHLNLINRGGTVLLAHLASRNPKFEVTAPSQIHRPTARLYELKLNLWAEQIDLKRRLRMCLLDALLSPCAIAKSTLMVGDELIKSMDRGETKGGPSMRRISWDDYVPDPIAREREEFFWEGYEYQVPFEMAMECGLFRKDLLEKLRKIKTPADKGDMVRNENLSRRYYGGQFDLVDMVRLVDIAVYDPRGTVIVTIPTLQDSVTDFLRIDNWKGPDRGPFHDLTFWPLPDNPHGVPWVAVVREAADLANLVMEKQAQQIARTRRIGIADEESDDDDLKAIAESQDGELKRVKGGPKSVGMMDFGGTSSELGPFIQQVTAFFNVAAGNPDILGGTGSNSDTATEFQGLAANAGLVLQDMQATTERFVGKVGEDALFFMANDPEQEEILPMRVDGGEFLEVIYSPKTKTGANLRFRAAVKAGSTLASLDPMVRIQHLQLGMGMIQQGVQMAMETGGVWNVGAQVRLLSRYLDDIEGWDELWNDPQLQMMSQAIGQMAPEDPPAQVAGMTPGLNPQALYPMGVQGASGNSPMQGAPSAPPRMGGAPGAMLAPGSAGTPLGARRPAMSRPPSPAAMAPKRPAMAGGGR